MNFRNNLQAFSWKTRQATALRVFRRLIILRGRCLRYFVRPTRDRHTEVMNVSSMSALLTVIAGVVGSIVGVCSTDAPWWLCLLLTTFGSALALGLACLSLSAGDWLLRDISGIASFAAFTSYMSLPLIVPVSAGLCCAFGLRLLLTAFGYPEISHHDQPRANKAVQPTAGADLFSTLSLTRTFTPRSMSTPAPAVG
jgi:hypothetical protein